MPIGFNSSPPSTQPTGSSTTPTRALPSGMCILRIRLRAEKKLRAAAIGTAMVVAISARKIVSMIFSITVTVVSLRYGRPVGQLPSTSSWCNCPSLPRMLGTSIWVRK